MVLQPPVFLFRCLLARSVFTWLSRDKFRRGSETGPNEMSGSCFLFYGRPRRESQWTDGFFGLLAETVSAKSWSIPTDGRMLARSCGPVVVVAGSGPSKWSSWVSVAARVAGQEIDFYCSCFSMATGKRSGIGGGNKDLHPASR